MTATRAVRWLVAFAAALVPAAMLSGAIASVNVDLLPEGIRWLVLGILLALWTGRGSDLGAVIGRGALLFAILLAGLPLAAAVATGSTPLWRVALPVLGFSSLPLALGYVGTRPQDLAHPRYAWIPRALLSIYPALALGLAFAAVGDAFTVVGIAVGLPLSWLALREARTRAGAIGRALILGGVATIFVGASGYLASPANDADAAFAAFALVFGGGLLAAGLASLWRRPRALVPAGASADL